MNEIISYLLLFATCAYVLYPLFKRQKAILGAVDTQNLQVLELSHQKNLIADTLSDLEFDLQTGKLSHEDYNMLAEEHQSMQREIERKLQAVSAGGRQEIKLSLEAEIAAEVQRLRGKAPASCPQCGHRVGANDKFCASCGAKLST